MTPKTIDELLELIPSQHRDQPRFRAWCALLMEPFRQGYELALALPSYFDLDTAVGVQADTLGLWIGRTRYVLVPLSDKFFTWDTTAEEGWNGAVWKGEFESPDDLITLSDEDYRKLLKAKVSANNWQGDRAGAYRTLRAAYGAKAAAIGIRDNQDMTQTVLYNSAALTITEETLLLREYVLIRPCGVGINFEKYFVPPFELDVFRGGSPLLADEVIHAGPVGEAVTFDADDWLVAKCWNPLSEELTVPIKVAGEVIGSAVFPAGGVAPVPAVVTMIPDDITLEGTEILELDVSGAAPAAGGDLSFNFLGYRRASY